ncbi:MAG TPA: helix-turn-helix domain-containing protein [Polyangiaceae bacterium]
MAAPTPKELALLNDFQVLVYRLFGVHATIHLRGMPLERNPWEAARPWLCHMVRKRKDLLARCQESDCALMKKAGQGRAVGRCHLGLGQFGVGIRRNGHIEGHLVCSPVRLDRETPAVLAARLAPRSSEIGMDSKVTTAFARDVPLLTRQGQRQLSWLCDAFFSRFFQSRVRSSHFFPWDPVRTASDDNTWVSFLWTHWWESTAPDLSTWVTQHAFSSLLYCPRQGCTVHFRRRKLVLKAGQMVLLPSGSEYRFAAEPGLFLEIYFYSSLDLSDLDYRILYPRGRVHATLTEIGRRALDDWEFSFKSEGKLKVLEFLMELRRLGARSSTSRGRPVRPGSAESVARALAFLSANVSRKIPLVQLAQFAGMNLYSLAHRFRAEVGISPLAYQRGLRITEAKRLLLVTQTPIKTIAYELGFANPKHFADAFRKATGLSPLHFRSQAGKS